MAILLSALKQVVAAKSLAANAAMERSPEGPA